MGRCVGWSVTGPPRPHRSSPHTSLRVCLFTSRIPVPFWWGLGLALDDTLSVGPSVADQGTLTSLAHFPSYAHQWPECKGSSRGNRRHREDDKDKT